MGANGDRLGLRYSGGGIVADGCMMEVGWWLMGA